MKANYLVLWNDGDMEFTDSLDLAKLGKLTCENSPSPIIKGCLIACIKMELCETW